MKKILLLVLLPFVYLIGEQTQISKDEFKDENKSYPYITSVNANTYLIQNILYPYYLGLGYRCVIGKNAIDFNLSIPVLFFTKDRYSFLNSDLSYIRYLDNKYYFISGISQQGGKSEFFKFYSLSPFVGFGKEIKFDDFKIFLHLKLNTLTYFPYLDARCNYIIPENLTRYSFWKTATYNLCAGFTF